MELLPITAELAATPAVASSPLMREVCEANIALYPDGRPPLPWAGYLAREQDVIVGTCAFKSQPEDGAVEIAYFTFPGHEGQGVATRMAGELLQLTAGHGLRTVRAQTSPEENASTAVLRKLGFTCIGPVEHPTDGTVWEWQRPA